MYKKLDEFGLDHDSDIIDAVKAESLLLTATKEYEDAVKEAATKENTPGKASEVTDDAFVVDVTKMSRMCRNRITETNEEKDDYFDEEFISAINKKVQEVQHEPKLIYEDKKFEEKSELKKVPSDIITFGRKITFDNIDLFVQPHEVTEDHPNQDIHWVSAMATENRVSGNHLSSEKPKPEKLLGMDNALCLPNTNDHKLQRKNYAALVGRIVTKHVNCLAFLEDVAVKHIRHQYSKEAANPTKTVSIHFNLNPLLCVEALHTVGAAKCFRELKTASKLS